MARFIRRLVPGLLAAVSVSCVSSGSLDGQSPTPTPAATPTRSSFESPLTVFISDLHFGLGRTADGGWNPLEDFRWSRALKGFLDDISQQTNHNTTLVIAGDMFEMWQHPSVPCRSGNADHGCTVAEMENIARLIVAGHRNDLAELGTFAARGNNRVVVVPGNHDAALLLPSVWAIVAPAFAAPAGRIERIDSGVWVSRNGQIVAEHGHQMPGEDVNGYKNWPRITDRLSGRDFMVRPWGELFVGRLYDDVEQRYYLIDNLIPQSNGLRHYLKDRGLFAAAADVARFIAFNLTESSLRQLGDLGEQKEGGPPPWDVSAARQLGWRLFARAMPKDDWFRTNLEQATAGEWLDVRTRLDALSRDARAVSDDEVRNLCDKGANFDPPPPDAELCPRRDASLGAEALKSLSPGARLRALQSHLRTRHAQVPTMRVFVYGHTHTVQCKTEVTPEGLSPFEVANTGAFQRLADDEKFVARATKNNLTPARALAQLPFDDLPPCYTAVLITYKDGDPVVQVKNWLMEETGGNGRFVDPWDCRCAKLGSTCKSTTPCN